MHVHSITLHFDNFTSRISYTIILKMSTNFVMYVVWHVCYVSNMYLVVLT